MAASVRARRRARPAPRGDVPHGTSSRAAPASRRRGWRVVESDGRSAGPGRGRAAADGRRRRAGDSGRRVRALRGALSRQPRGDRGGPALLPRLPEGSSGPGARRRLRARRVPRLLRSAEDRGPRRRIESGLRRGLPRRGPRRGGGRRDREPLREAGGLARRRSSPSRSSSTGRPRRSSASSSRRAAPWRPAACSSPRRSTRTRSRRCAPSTWIRPTSGPCRPRPCASWPRPRGFTEIRDRVPLAAPRRGATDGVERQRQEAQRAALRRPGLRAHRPRAPLAGQSSPRVLVLAVQTPFSDGGAERHVRRLTEELRAARRGGRPGLDPAGRARALRPRARGGDLAGPRPLARSAAGRSTR